MSEKYFVLKGVAGLGNRIEAFLGAVVFSIASGRKLVVDWTDGLYAARGENAFDALFVSPAIVRDLQPSFLEGRTTAPFAWAGELDKSVYRHPLYRAGDPKDLGAILKLRESLSIDPSLLLTYDQDVIVYYGYGFEAPLELVTQHNILDQRPPDRETAIRMLLHRYVTVRPEIVAAADELQNSLFTSPNTIAVHIRNTDNQNSERFKIDTARHLSIVRRLCKRKSNSAVFLATDSAATERLYRELIPNIGFVKKCYPRDSSESLHHTQDLRDKKQSTVDTMVELLLLGRADTLIHSSKSTFAQTGLRLVDNPRIRVIDVESFTARLCVVFGLNEPELKRRFAALRRNVAALRRAKSKARRWIRGLESQRRSRGASATRRECQTR